MTRRELLRRIDSRELTEWRAYERFEPWGEDRADYRNGILASVFANAFRNPKKRRKPFKPEDFLPRFDRQESERPDWENLLSKVVAINAAFKGKDLRKK